MGNDTVLLLSAASLVEISIVLAARGGEECMRDLDEWLSTMAVQIVSLTAEQAHLAREAWVRFGKGHHPAGLNFGDCFSYALAQTTGEPLLYKGNDFSKTDIRSVLHEP